MPESSGSERPFQRRGDGNRFETLRIGEGAALWKDVDTTSVEVVHEVMEVTACSMKFLHADVKRPLASAIVDEGNRSVWIARIVHRARGATEYHAAK